MIRSTIRLFMFIMLFAVLAPEASAQDGDEELEPNDAAESATAVRLGVVMDGESAGPADADWLQVEVARRGPFALTLEQREGTGGPLGVRVRQGDVEPTYVYVLPTEDAKGLFFPVLEPGTWHFDIYRAGDAEDVVAWRVTLAPHEPVLTDATRAEALAAITKATAWLDARTGETIEGQYPEAMKALVLAALVESDDPARLKRLEDGLIAQLASRVEERDGAWRGKPVRSASAGIYEQAVITLALAEATAHGSAKAKELLVPAAESLLAAQLTEARDEGWGKVARPAESHGGWRYAFNAPDADLSATGWCFVALAATNAAGVRVEGTRDALSFASDFVQRCVSAEGFVYMPGTSEGGDVRDAVGALVMLMHGEESETLDRALDALDAHLPPWTQVDRGEPYPLYYAYYATRVHYLRGGRPWQVWRTTMLRQLLKNQAADGSWRGFATDAEHGSDYSTSLGLMILRMCLEQVPAYLKREVRGF